MKDRRLAQLLGRRAKIEIEGVGVPSGEDEPVRPADDAVRRSAGPELRELKALGGASADVHDGELAVTRQEEEPRRARRSLRDRLGAALRDTSGASCRSS